MRLSGAVTILILVAAAASIEAARYSSRSIRIRYSRSHRYSYRSSRHTYMGPIYARRLSPSVMGPLYFGYASRYPMHFSYRSRSMSASGELCTNNLALDNGSHVGVFSCPFLSDEPSGWTRCCGYKTEEFCCDPEYDDSWKKAGLSVAAIVLITGGCLLAVGVAVGLLVFCCCCCCAKKNGGPSASPFVAGKAAAGQPQQQGKPFVDPAGKQVDGSNPVPPPYPTMEYGTIQPQATAGAANRGGYNSAPYPAQPQMPQPPPYRSD